MSTTPSDSEPSPMRIGTSILLAVINDRIRAVDGVRETETFMHVRTEKNVFAWGRRVAGS